MKNITNSNTEIEKSNKLIGYDDLFIKFEKFYLNKRLPKVILLSGDKGIGKSTLAYHFINYILSVESDSFDNYSKFLLSNNANDYGVLVLLCSLEGSVSESDSITS